ncbi:MAG TPA: hypothetical protein VGN37_06805 [Actinocatenispora sp.]
MIDRAVRNNAAWCAAVCRAHGLATTADADAWTSPRRTPPYYPDAVTLRPDCAADVLARVDAGPGCSVKDSFGTLDLTGHGFTVIIEATWLHRAESTAAPAYDGWRRVGDPAGLAAWTAAWGGGDGILVPALLADDDVAVLARYAGGEITAGATVNRAAGAVGVTNLFGDDAWNGAVAAAYDVFGPHPVVGYEHGPALTAALDAGFTRLGPLRIWLKP